MAAVPRKECSFCGRAVHLGEGVMVIKNDGVVFWFCRAKCRKNALKLHRDPRKYKWTTSYKKVTAAK